MSAGCATTPSGQTASASCPCEWVIECDSWLTGVGGGAFFAEEYSPGFVRAYLLIHELEALNLVVALRTLRTDVCAGLDLIMNIDNATSAHALGMVQATDPRGLRP